MPRGERKPQSLRSALPLLFSGKGIRMRKSVPDSLFTDRDQVRLSALSNWVLDYGVTEIVMTEKQFWKFVTAQPLAEKPKARKARAGRSVSARPASRPEREQRPKKGAEH